MLLCKNFYFISDRSIDSIFTHLSNNLGDENEKTTKKSEKKNMTKNIYNFISSVDKYILYKLIYDENSLKPRKRKKERRKNLLFIYFN